MSDFSEDLTLRSVSECTLTSSSQSIYRHECISLDDFRCLMYVQVTSHQASGVPPWFYGGKWSKGGIPPVF